MGENGKRAGRRLRDLHRERGCAAHEGSSRTMLEGIALALRHDLDHQPAGLLGAHNRAVARRRKKPGDDAGCGYDLDEGSARGIWSYDGVRRLAIGGAIRVTQNKQAAVHRDERFLFLRCMRQHGRLPVSRHLDALPNVNLTLGNTDVW